MPPPMSDPAAPPTEPPASQGLARAAASGVAWTTLAKVVSQATGIGVTLLLARLLTPRDFGLVGMVSVFSGFVALLGELGFGAALVQRSELEERHLSTVFWFNSAAGLVLGAAMAAAAPLLAEFYGEPKLIGLTRAVALSFVIMPLGAVHQAVLSRKLGFKSLAWVDTAVALLSAVVAVIAALRGMGPWALVLRSLTVAGAGVVGLWLVAGWRPRVLFDARALKELLGFSANLFAFNAVNYWARNGDQLLIGKFLGAASVGIYARAYSTMTMPISEVTSVLTKVMFPTLSRLQHRHDELRALYLRSLQNIALLTFPLMSVLLAVASPFVLSVFGPNWAEVVPVLQVLCPVAMLQSIGTTVGWIYQATGRTDVMFRYGAIVSPLILGSIGVGVALGSPLTVAIAYAVMNLVILPYPQFAVAGRLIGLKPLQVLSAVKASLAHSVAASVPAWAVGAYLPAPHLVRFVAGALTGLGLYAAIVHGLRAPAYLRLREQLGDMLRSRSGKVSQR